MALARINVNSRILTWAINRSGRDMEEYLANHSIVKKWIDGEKQPTLKQLEKVAKELYVPFGYFFLPTPPEESMPIPLFRRMQNRMDINVYDTVNDMQERQEWLCGYLRRNDFERLSFVGRHKDTDDVEGICRTMRQVTGMPINWMMDFRTVDEALKHFTEILESLGIIVVYNSVVGFNNSRPIEVDECRGFALVDDTAPFIFVNSRDAKSAQMFTLAHEFAHVLTGFTAGLADEDIAKTPQNEQVCDKVAALFLVPPALLKEEWSQIGENFEVLCKRFKVSRYVLARCAHDYNLISTEHYFKLYNKWHSEPTMTRTKKTSGGDFKRTAIKRTSRLFLIHVNNAIERNELLWMDAYRLTGMKGDTFRKVVNSEYFV